MADTGRLASSERTLSARRFAHAKAVRRAVALLHLSCRCSTSQWGMAVVAGNHIKVFFPALLKGDVQTKAGAAHNPLVKGFLHNQHTQLIAGVQERRAKGVVRARMASKPLSLIRRIRRISAAAWSAAPRSS